MAHRYALWRYAAGALAARVGDEMSGPALLLFGFAATGAMATGSALLAGITAAAAVGGPLVGALMDRSARPGRLLAAALTLYAVGLALVACAVGRVPLVVVVGLALGVGLLGPALSGGWTARLPGVVPPEGMPRASALDAMTFGAASLVGPAAAALVAATAGPASAVGTAVVFIILALPVAWSLPRGRQVGARTPLSAALLAGARVVAANPALRRVTAVTVVSITGTGMLVVCAPVLGARVLGGHAHGALLLSVMALCALLANLVLARKPPRPDTAVLVCVLVQAAGTALAVVADSAVPLVLAAAVVGAAEGPQLTGLFTVRHREAPDHLRTQVFTTGASLKVSAFALGAAVAGPLADWSVTVCLAAAAGLHLLAALVYVFLSGSE